MGVTPKDSDAKVRLGYKEPKSVVWADGREKLVGWDWRVRKLELWSRCGGKCEVFLELIGGPRWRCENDAQDPHHKIKRSKQRDDRMDNLLAVCRRHHDLLDERRIRSDRAERRTA